MTIVSHDPSQWPLINLYHANSYFSVASFTIVVYDCVLTFSQELELIWTKKWSLMTVLYLSVRYIGIPFNIINLFATLPAVSLTDAGCNVIYSAVVWIAFFVNTMLDVIMLTRVHAMYQGSRTMLIFLVAIFPLVTIACAVLVSLQCSITPMEEVVMSGTYQCIHTTAKSQPLWTYSWVVSIVWQLFLLGLVIWSAVKHFREVSGRRTVDDCFTVLLRTHVFYAVAFFSVSCFCLVVVTQNFVGFTSVGGEIWLCFTQISAVVQLFVLGPRLILSVRACNAKDMTAYDEVSVLTTIAFQRPEQNNR